MDRGRIDKLTSDQHSLITTRQFIEASGSESALRWAVRDGWLERYERWRATYIVAGAPRTPYQPHMAACLLGGPHAAAFGFARGLVVERADAADCLPDIAILGGPAVHVHGTRMHHSQYFGLDDIVLRHRVPTAARRSSSSNSPRTAPRTSPSGSRTI